MYRCKKLILFFLFFLLFRTGDGFGQERVIEKEKWLTVTDLAPTIEVESWFKGDHFEGFKKDKVYVVECWATWCGPCIRAFPHLTDLQKKYKDRVLFLGIGVWEDNDKEETNEMRLERISRFVQEQGDNMGYTVGLERNKSMAKNWLAPAAQNGIPCAFIVDSSSKVAWIGHPMSMDKPLEEIVNGSWDYEKAKKEHEKVLKEAEEEKKMRLEFKIAKDTGNWSNYLSMIDIYIEKNKDDIMQSQSLRMQKFMTCIMEVKNKTKAYQCAAIFASKGWNNSSDLNMISWTIADELDKKMQDLDFALWVAKRACELTDYKDSMIIDTLARVYWEQGVYRKAIDWQQKALDMAEESSKASYKKTLDLYLGEFAIKNSGS